jgi:hypothetical protein
MEDSHQVYAVRLGHEAVTQETQGTLSGDFGIIIISY